MDDMKAGRTDERMKRTDNRTTGQYERYEGWTTDETMNDNTDNRTTGQQDNRTTGQRDDRTTRRPVDWTRDGGIILTTG